MLRNALFTLLLAISGAPLMLSADTLVMEGINIPVNSSTQQPGRGMSMNKVRETFGVPILEQSPVGDPPIARWEYPDFIVYFEYSTVIHSVTRQPDS